MKFQIPKGESFLPKVYCNLHLKSISVTCLFTSCKSCGFKTINYTNNNLAYL